MSNELKQVFSYHQETKHSYEAYAPGPGFLEWVTQPDSFRRYPGTALIRLRQLPPANGPRYDDAFEPDRIPPARLDFQSVSQLFFDSLAISAWKSVQGATWSLRVNPSSGDLHPSEGYLICGPVAALTNEPLVCHYAPKEHSLEVRAKPLPALWERLRSTFPEATVFLGLTSIHWRESWKYGQRAYRYCQHDCGHAIAAVCFAAAALGWQARLLDDLGSEDLKVLLGTGQTVGEEHEEPNCLLALCPYRTPIEPTCLPIDIVDEFKRVDWLGIPNQLSPSHHDWGMAPITLAARKSRTAYIHDPLPTEECPAPPVSRPVSLRQIIRQRRSAVAMDGETTLEASAFFQVLRHCLHIPDRPPFTALPWPPSTHFTVFVHRVDGLTPGIYMLVRNPEQMAALQAACTTGGAWTIPEGCPPDLDFYLIRDDDVRELARKISCYQAIASDSCFSLGMIAAFDEPLRRFGPWFYPRLFWETGALGQILYLEAEAAGIGSTGIGCYFDDPMHELLGLRDSEFQDLYHFTFGRPVLDHRLTTLPAYDKNLE